MRRADWLAAVWTIALGLLFLTVAAAGLSRPTWLPEGVVNTIVRWAPVGCFLGLIGVGIAIAIPWTPQKRRSPE